VAPGLNKVGIRTCIRADKEIPSFSFGTQNMEVISSVTVKCAEGDMVIEIK
jgi:hypothetical protein